MKELTPTEIVERMRLGDVTGLEALLRQDGPEAKSWLAFRYGLPAWTSELEDAVHDAALTMFRRAGRLDPGQNLTGYLIVTASNELRRRLAEQDGSLESLEEAHLDVPDDRAETQLVAGRASAFVTALRAELDDLADLERSVLALDAGSDFTMTAGAIAEELGTTPRTVYTMRNRTKKRLEQFCNGWRRRRRGIEGDG